jgi:drug/metabolite transporter (DMT)-like permease
MDLLFVGLALGSALLHASWNTFVKSAGDRLVAISTIALGFTVTGAVMIPIYGVPDRMSWPYLILTTVFYYAYLWLLHRAYRVGDISHAYPLFQGAAPLFVAVGAAFFGGEWLTPLAALGVLLTSLGIMSLAVFGKPAVRHPPREIYALTAATSLVIATMMVSNALGSRASGSPLAFIAWTLFLQAPVAGVGVALRRGQFADAVRNEPIKVVAAGMCATLAYGLSIYASTYAPMAGVAALRQTSVVIASLFGTIILGERPWRPRVAAACLITVGSVLVAVEDVRPEISSSFHSNGTLRSCWTLAKVVESNVYCTPDPSHFARFNTIAGVRKAVGIWCGAISSNMKVSFQAARSIG